MHSHNYFVKSKIKLVVFSILILFLKVGSISSHEPVFDACPNLKNYSSELMVEILQIKSTIEQEKKNKLNNSQTERSWGSVRISNTSSLKLLNQNLKTQLDGLHKISVVYSVFCKEFKR